MNTAIAVFATATVVGTWVGIRAAEAREQLRRTHDLRTYLLSIPDEEWRR